MYYTIDTDKCTAFLYIDISLVGLVRIRRREGMHIRRGSVDTRLKKLRHQDCEASGIRMAEAWSIRMAEAWSIIMERSGHKERMPTW